MTQRILHVIAAYHVNEAQGRAIATIAAHTDAEHHLVCAEVQSDVSLFASVHETGGALSGFGFADRDKLAAAVRDVRPDVVHVHGGPLLALSLAGGWTNKTPVVMSLYAWSRVPLSAAKSGVPFRYLRDTPVLATRSVVNTFLPPAVVAAAMKRANVRMVVTQDPDIHALLARQALPATLAEGITEPQVQAPRERDRARFVFAGRAELTRGPDILAEAIGLLRARGVDATAEFFMRSTRDADFVSSVVGTPGCSVAVGDVDLAAKMRTATAVVLPFRFDTTTLAPALVATEAMALGTAVVACDVACLRAAVTDATTGLVVARDDPNALAAALEQLVAEPGLADRLGAAGAAEIARRWESSSLPDASSWAYTVALGAAVGVPR